MARPETIENRIGNLTEAEAKFALLWALNGFSCELRCDDCGAKEKCPPSEALWKGNLCMCNLLDVALEAYRIDGN